MKKKTKVKRKLKVHNFFLVLILFLLFSFCLVSLYQMPIQNIIITGTTYLKDSEIIETAGIKEYPSLFRISSSSMKKKLLELEFISSVRIHKSIFGRLTIEIQEEIPLFYNRNREVLVFASGKEMKTQELYGMPILVNYVPDELYQRLLKEMKETNGDILKMISEIEYQPWKSDDVIIDDTRFFLRMNDGNVVYVNLINFEKLNNYMTIYSTLGEAKGTLQLDSSLGNGITFTPYS